MTFVAKPFLWIVFAIAAVCQLQGRDLLIQAKSVQKNTVSFRLSPRFTQKYVKNSLKISYPKEVDLEALPSSIVDLPLITNTIAAIWLSGEVYEIDEMDEDLYDSLRIVKAFFQRFFCNTSWEGELVPIRLVKNCVPTTSLQTAALFTGGLDSTATVFRHLHEDLMLISFNPPHQTAALFAKDHQLPLLEIEVNYSSFLKLTKLDKASCDISKWFWDTSMGLAWVGTAAPLLYAKGISRLYIPSGFTWRSFLFPDGNTLRQPASPLIDENLAPAGVQVKHDPFDMTRAEKMKMISSFCIENHLAKPHLVVCNHHAKADHSYLPCNRCPKCLLTMLDILAIGEQFHEYGFCLPEEEFINRFQDDLTRRPMKRGGTYAAYRDSQRYIGAHIQDLPEQYRPFYEWFLALDLDSMIDPHSSCPPRLTPFDWEDYQDIYPGVRFFSE